MLQDLRPRTSCHKLCLFLFGVVDDLFVHIFGNFGGESHSDGYDFLRIEGGEAAEDLVRTVTKRQCW